MKEIGSFNKLSTELRAKLPTLEPGQSVTYELVPHEIDHITKLPLYGGARVIPGRDRIKDGNTIVDIGIPRVYDSKEVKKCEKYQLTGGGENGRVPPRFELSGDSIEDILWHQFFFIANFNESNPNRDKSVKPLIRVVDHEAEAKSRRSKRSEKRQAMDAAQNIDGGEVRMYAASFGWPTEGIKVDLLRDKLEDYAEKFPNEFLKRVKDPKTSDMAEIQVAMDKGLIAYDHTNHQLRWAESNNFICLLDREDKPLPELIDKAIQKLPDSVQIRTTIRAKAKLLLTGNKNKEKDKEKVPEGQE
jgi:hypothetical protein